MRKGIYERVRIDIYERVCDGLPHIFCMFFLDGVI